MPNYDAERKAHKAMTEIPNIGDSRRRFEEAVAGLPNWKRTEAYAYVQMLGKELAKKEAELNDIADQQVIAIKALSNWSLAAQQIHKQLDEIEAAVARDAAPARLAGVVSRIRALLPTQVEVPNVSR